jgi:hypothetical protein
LEKKMVRANGPERVAPMLDGTLQGVAERFSERSSLKGKGHRVLYNY